MSRGGLSLVTGANGFLGLKLCAALATRGWDVRGLVRRTRDGLPEGVDAVRGEVTDRGALRLALEGVETVYHLAARVHVMRDSAADPLTAFRRVNVEGTRLLLEEAAAAGARRFVYVSSVKAVAEMGEQVLTEESPPEPVDPYGISKLEAEHLVQSAVVEEGLQAAVLRFPLVYGPGMRANMLRLFELVDRGVPLPFGGIENRRSILFSGNAVEAMLATAAAPAAAGATFFVSDGPALSTPELVRAIAAALDVSPRLVGVPPGWLRLAGRAGDAVGRLVPFPLSSAAMDRLLGSLVIDSSKLERVVGFEPPYSTGEGLSLTAEWYRGRGPGSADR